MDVLNVSFNNSNDINRKNFDKRRISRILALMFLYNYFFYQSLELEIKIKEKLLYLFETINLLEIIEEKKYNKKLYINLVESVIENKNQSDTIIQKYAPLWPLNEMNLLNLCILRISITEGYIKKLTPYKVAINEAVEITKLFTNEYNAKFINGVLGGVFNAMNN